MCDWDLRGGGGYWDVVIRMEDIYATLEVVKGCLYEDPRGVPKELIELVREMWRRCVSVDEFRGVMDDLRIFLGDQYRSEFFFNPGYKYLELWVNDVELCYWCKKEGVPTWMEGVADEVMGRIKIFEDLGPK